MGGSDGGGWTLVSRIKGNSPNHDKTSSAAVGTLTSPPQDSVGRLDNGVISAIKGSGDGILRLFCGSTGKIFSDHWQNYNAQHMSSSRHFKYAITDGWSSCSQSSSDHTAMVSTKGRCKGGSDPRDASYGCLGCGGCSQNNH